MRRRLAILLLVAACSGGQEPVPTASTGDTGEVSDVPCAPRGEPELEVAHGDDDWGLDDVDVEVGIPPQGGAPYARFQIRVANLHLASGGDVVVELEDVDLEQRIGVASVPVGFVCANVGENADHWVTPEVHVRFDGIDLLDLPGRSVRIHARVDGEEGHAEVSGAGVLVLDPRFDEL